MQGLHQPPSQDNVTLTRDFSNAAASMLGAVPIVNDPQNANPAIQEFLAATPIANKVILTRDAKTGKCQPSVKLAKQTVSTGSYPQQAEWAEDHISKGDDVSGGSWVKAGSPLGSKWKYQVSGNYVNSCWVHEGEKWYYIDADEYMVTGSVEIDGKDYCFKSKEEDKTGTNDYGQMISHKWWKIDGTWYYFHADGSMLVNGWRMDAAQKAWYYCGADGKMVTSQVISYNGKDYYVDENGVMAENKEVTVSDSGTKYWADADGVLGEKPDVDLFIQTYVWDYFTKKFNQVQTAGIMGNAMQESKWNPLCKSSGNSHWGLFQINKTLSLELEKEYAAVGLEMNLYGYSSSKYQKFGAEKNIPMEDLQKILDVQLEFVYRNEGSGHDWIDPLREATTVNEAAEVFLVKFEGATSTNKLSKNEIKYYKKYIGSYYQDAETRRDYATSYYKQFAK